MERKNGFLYFSPTDQCINEQCWLAFFFQKLKEGIVKYSIHYLKNVLKIEEMLNKVFFIIFSKINVK